MTAIASYLRHLIVTGLLLLVSSYQLPLAGSEEAANAIALLVLGTGTWVIVKYLPNLAKYLGLPCALLLLLPGCATTVTTTTMPDGTTIVVNARSADKEAIDAALAASAIILPLVIHPEK